MKYTKHYTKNAAYLLAVLSTPSFAFQLNDTAVTNCSNATQNNLHCPVTGFSGQDAEHGVNGFNFTKLDAAGVEMSTTATDHVCVRDNVTGLMWEVKTNDSGLRDQDWTYVWNTINAYAQAVNDVGLCGFRDWRIPTVTELTSIVDYSNTTPSIATKYFPNTKSGWYWTSTTASYGSGSAWAVTFHHGQISDNARSKPYFVRLVRGNTTTSTFVDNGDGTVTDNAYGLMWSKCSVGLDGDKCDNGRLKPLNWDEALNTARTSRLANYADWRLPNVKELQSLADYAVHSPSINVTNFPNTSPHLYWSSTPHTYADARPNYSWTVNFRYGYIYMEDDARTEQRAVRLVRTAKSNLILNHNSANTNQDWNFVNVPTGFDNVIILAGPPTYNEIDPGVARLHNIGALGFDLRFQEWEYRATEFLDTTHIDETIPYMTLIRGRHQQSDESIWEVGAFQATRAGVWHTIPFVGAFNHPPYLFLTVQTYNDSRPVTARARNVNTNNFEIALFEEEALMDGHSIETIGYLAIEAPNLSSVYPGRNISDIFPYLLQNFDTDQRFTPILSQRIKLEEERSVDDEINHPDEQIHALAIGHQIFAQQVSHNDADTTALRRIPPPNNAPLEWGLVRNITHTWDVLPFVKTYQTPVLITSPISMFEDGAGVVRTRNLNPNYAEVRYQEWDYLDGIHDVGENIFYFVIEAGAYTLGNPDQILMLEANRIDTNKLARNNEWEQVTLSAEILHPVIFASVLTSNSSDDITRANNAVNTRITDANDLGFKLAMDQQELQTDGHTTETLGWLAIETSKTLVLDKLKLHAAFAIVDSVLDTTYYPFTTEHRYPSIIGQVSTVHELDPISLQYVDPNGDSVLLRLVEEQSYDTELDHVLEEVGLFIGE